MLRATSEELKQGDWCFLEGTAKIEIRWGDNPADTIQLALVGRSTAIWRFEGTEAKPTLSPAIWAGGKWFRMTDGVLTQK